MNVIKQQRRVKKHVAILGFAEPCGPYNQSLAYKTGLSLAEQGYVVTAGNVTLTFYSAFIRCKTCQRNDISRTRRTNGA